MDEVSVLIVRDKDEDQEALAIVRSVNGFVALTLSLEHGSDVEVGFTPSECEDLVQRLQRAIFNVQNATLVTARPTTSVKRNDTEVSWQEITELEIDRGGKVKHG